MPALPEPHAIAVLALTVLTFWLFSRDWIAIESTSVVVMAALALGFHLFPFVHNGVATFPEEFFLGFGHEALITICGLMVMGRGLALTGALEPIARLLSAALARMPQLAMLVVLVFCAGASGVLNDTPIVVLMMPILVSAALRTGTSPALTLLPMNYAVLIGGMGTTIGTSTNLLVVSIAADLGVRRFGMFDFIHVTALAAIGGILYLWLVLPRLITARETPIGDASPQIFSAVLSLREKGYGDGKPFSELRGKAGKRVRIQRVVRGETLELARLPTLALRAGDRLYVTAKAGDLREFADEIGAALHNVDEPEKPVGDETPLAPAAPMLAEVVVTEGSSLHRSTLGMTRFAEQHEVIIVGLHRAGGVTMPASDDLSDTVLRMGDVLLVQGSEENIAKLHARAGLLVLDRSYELPRTAKAPLVLAVLIAVVASAAFKLVPISVASLVGVGILVLTRCMDWEEAAGALSTKVILLVAASLALGSALTRTGATDYIATLVLLAARDLSPEWLIVMLMVLMAVLTNFISNNAAAAIGTPIAVSMATQLGVSAETLVLAILFGANFCYVTPMAYQTNLLVMNAGGYRFADFVRGGLPLALIMLASYAFLLPRYFPL